MARDQLGIFDTPPSRREVRLSLAIVGLLCVVALLILPVRYHRLGALDAFVPMFNAILFLGDLIIATLLYAQAAIVRSRALTVLATGYVFCGLLAIAHALTFPGAFSPDGLLGAELSTAGWISYFRRVGVPIAIIFYVLLRPAELAAQAGTKRPAASITLALLAALALAAAMTVLATIGHDLLPPLFVNAADTIRTNVFLLECGILTLFVVATAMLLRKRSSVLDMWLLVALSGLVIQSLLLLLTLTSRFTAGWYWQYCMVLFTHLIVMLALIAESSRLYARLALSVMAQKRERDARLMSMDAVAAAISHEVGQPLSAVNTNALAGLNWLTRPRPDLEMAIKALRAALDAGHRAFDIIKGIQTMFAKEEATVTRFSLNELVRETVALLGRELAGIRVSLHLARDEALPRILGDRVQLQQVLVNLLTNAIESVRATPDRPRHIAIRTVPLDGEEVLLEVSDTGRGIGPEAMEHIFDAFYTTKATGTGLGLSLCRTIVEEHGGRLWASRRGEHGAIFHMQLPPRRSLAAAE